MKKHLVISCFIFLILISAAFWIITPIGIDFETNAFRIGELARELARPGSDFPVYVYKDVYNHYGYPMPIFYGSIWLLPFAALVQAGISVLSAYKAMIITVLWLSFLSAFLCLKSELDDRDKALFGAFMYAMSPFFLIELFVRSASGASCVFIFIPLVLSGYVKITRNRPDILRGIVLLGGGMAGIITSHVTSTVIVVIAMAVCFLGSLPSMPDRLKKTGYILCSALICFLISAWYLLPMLEQLMSDEYIGSSVTELMIPNENLLALLIPMHLSQAVSALLHTELPFSMIGGCVVTMIVTVVRFFIRRKSNSGKEGQSGDNIRTDRRLTTLVLTYFIIVAILLVHWTFVEKYVAFIQFAWRIFLIAAVCEIFFCILYSIEGNDSGFDRFRIILGIIIAAYVLVFFFGYHAVKGITPETISSVAGHEITAYSYSYTSETADELYLPVSVDKQSLFDHKREVVPDTGDGDRISAYDANGDGGIYSYSIDDEHATVDIELLKIVPEEGLVLKCPFIYYKGYSASSASSDASYEVFASDDGLTDVRIPKGANGSITVRYTGTMIQRVSFIVSVVSVILFIFVPAVIWRRVKV